MERLEPQLLGLAVAVALGLLVGLQREFVGKRIGIRSFALIGGIGGIVGVLTADHGGWVLASGLIATSIMIYAHDLLTEKKMPVSGMTTELAAVAMFLVGALATLGYLQSAVVFAGGVVLLLHWKTPMHSGVKRIGTAEFEAIVRFVLITLVLLPILPDTAYGPYGVLNPRLIWLMVILIVGLNLAGYVALKLVNGRGGAALGGVLGGLISSTATTVSFSTKCREDGSLAPVAAVVILVASAFVYVRILIELGVVAPDLVVPMLGPVAVLVAVFAVLVGWNMRHVASASTNNVDPRNPADLKTALSFTLLYAVVLFVSAAVNDYLGETALYPVAVVSGLTDVDAITLSVGRLYADSRLDGDTAWRVILVASISNLAFKSGIVAVIGGRELRRLVLPGTALLSVLGYLLAWLWP